MDGRPSLRIVLAALAAGLLVFGIAGPAGATFPGKNGVILFDAVDYSTNTVQIFQIGANGGGLEQLTFNPAGGNVWNEDPAPTSDGAKIYFTSTDRAANTPSEITSMDADGNNQQGIGAEGVWPSVNWKDSSLAVVQFVPAGQSVIVTMKPDGTNQKVVGDATPNQGAGGPDYAPNGPRLAWYLVTFGPGGQGFASSDIFVRNGSHNNNITDGSSELFTSPAWAPNGSKLIAITGENQQTIVSMRANGTGVQELISIGGGVAVSIASAVYSPDGKKIAYLRCDGDCGDPFVQDPGQGSIWVMNADGSDNHMIFNGTGFSPNGVQPADRLSWVAN
jgi:Tol biopolymer transport system component